MNKLSLCILSSLNARILFKNHIAYTDNNTKCPHLKIIFCVAGDDNSVKENTSPATTTSTMTSVVDNNNYYNDDGAADTNVSPVLLPVPHHERCRRLPTHKCNERFNVFFICDAIFTFVTFFLKLKKNTY